ncbi:MAG: hypothetical protein E6Q97_25865 [Desulfurellales bacterium]|nr:MAG: hypothetical protein E6Q97_25865 [Desulfurellales bacterium]
MSEAVDREKFGTCVRCGRPLSNEESARAGMGPVCRAKAAATDSGALLADTPVLCDVPPVAEVGLICRRLSDGRAATNVPHIVLQHSPTGFEWGYSGSGPAELALNVLHLILPPTGWEPARPLPHAVRRGEHVLVSESAERLHHLFKWAFLAGLPKAGGHIPLEVINEWVSREMVWGKP